MLFFLVIRVAILGLVASRVLLEVPKSRSVIWTSTSIAVIAFLLLGLLLMIFDRLLVHLIQRL